MADEYNLAPVYRYFTVDLLSNEILAEIPFEGVSYQNAIKAAGTFAGKIPVIEDTAHMDLYENTMPGNTALFAVRDGVCVWGGIIWSRRYDIVGRTLDVSASEFTSYFQHRRLWKNWSQTFSATVVVNGNTSTVVLDTEETAGATPGSTVRVEFYEVNNFGYNGYYEVSASPAPTTKKFYLSSPTSTLNISRISVANGIVTVITEDAHGLSTNDQVDIDLEAAYESYNGKVKITVPYGPLTNVFTYELVNNSDNLSQADATGTVKKNIPNGTYKLCSVSVRSDTYHHIRSLIEAVATDFVGSDFANVYVEPGISFGYEVINKSLLEGFAELTTSEPHRLAVGQAVSIQDVGPEFDGENQVANIQDDYTFSYKKSGQVESTALSAKYLEVVSVAAKNGKATVKTIRAHRYLKDQNVTLNIETDLGDMATYFNGTFKITSVPDATTFIYDIATNKTLSLPDFTLPTVQVPDNVTVITHREGLGNNRRITTSQSHNYVPGDVITVSDMAVASYNGTFTIQSVERTTITYTASSFLVEAKTADAGSFINRVEVTQGNVVNVTAASTQENVTHKQSSGVTRTITTGTQHVFAVGDSIVVSSVGAGYDATGTVTGVGETTVSYTFAGAASVTESKTAVSPVGSVIISLSGGATSYAVATITTAKARDFTVGNTVNVQNANLVTRISEKSLVPKGAANATDALATVTTSENHNLKTGDLVSISGLRDASLATSKTIATISATVTHRSSSGTTRTLFVNSPHYLNVGDEIVVAGINANYNGTFSLTGSSANTITYTKAGALTEAKTGTSITVTTTSNKLVSFTTDIPHNFKVGDSVDVEDMTDVYLPTSRSIASSVFTITTGDNHNITADKIIDVTGIYDTYTITYVQIKDNVGTVTLSAEHNIQVNDTVELSNIKDSLAAVQMEMNRGVVTLTTKIPHNFVEAEKIFVSGLSKSGLNGQYTVLSVTDTRVSYEAAVAEKIYAAEDKYNRALAKAIRNNVRSPYNDADVVAARNELNKLVRDSGTIPPTNENAVIRSEGSAFNGPQVVSAITANTFDFFITANNVPKTAVSTRQTRILKRAATTSTVTLTVDTVTDFAAGDIVSIPEAFGVRFAGTHMLTTVNTRNNTDGTKTHTVSYVYGGAEVAEVDVINLRYMTAVGRATTPSLFNGEHTVLSVTSNTMTYEKRINVTERSATATTCSLKFTNKYPVFKNDQITVTLSGANAARYNGTFTIQTITTSQDETTITYVNSGAVEATTPQETGYIRLNKKNLSATAVTPPITDAEEQPQVSTESIHIGTRVVRATERNKISFKQASIANNVTYSDLVGSISAKSVFNTPSTQITVTSPTQFQYTIGGGIVNSVFETTVSQQAYVICASIFNIAAGSVITSVDSANNRISYRLPSTRDSFTDRTLPGYGQSIVVPTAVVGTYGPYPGNSDIGITFSTNKYSGLNILPTSYLGYELTNVGEALDNYADSINGFDYRIDCTYDESTGRFKKEFVLIPVKVPGDIVPGEAMPLDRLGADALVFEYPGNIANVVMDESAENSATRFFAVGETDSGAEYGPNFSVSTDVDLLRGNLGKRRWPLLDDDEQIKGTDNKSDLYAHAIRYQKESRPPVSEISINVNGSLEPFVGSYKPGDYCSIIVNDYFILQRLASDLEPRDNLIVRKIESIQVSVPDGVAFPENVTLNLISEWEVDNLGQS